MIHTAPLRFTCGLGFVSLLALTACIDVDGLLFVRDASGGGGGEPSSSTGSTSSGGGQGGAGQGGAGQGGGGQGGGGQGGGTTQPTYADVVLSDSPLAYFRFEETSTAPVGDSSPSGLEAVALSNGGTVTRGVPGALQGDAGLAIGLSGGARVLLEPNTLELGTNSSYTIEAWVRVEASSTGAALFRWLEPNNPQSGYLTSFDSQTLQHKRYDTAGSSESIYLSPTDLTGDFHHVVVTVGPTGVLTYVDGAPAAVRGPFELVLPTHSAPLFVVDAPGGADLVVDEVAYYPFAMSVVRVESHHRCGTTGECELAP